LDKLSELVTSVPLSVESLLINRFQVNGVLPVTKKDVEEMVISTEIFADKDILLLAKFCIPSRNI
jgi:hypothetical protein